jgi:GTPase
MKEWFISLSGVQIATNCPLSCPSIQVMVDREYGNLIVELGNRVETSFEGEAFVTVGVDNQGRIAYISVETLDKDLRDGAKSIGKE